MTATPEDELTYLCSLFGSCSYRSQGGGGNISVKDKDYLYIKASGFRLCSVNQKTGFVICDSNAVRQCLQKNEENIESTLTIESSLKPSMESFFHLLPKKYVVHLHPTFFCRYLCRENAEVLFSPVNFPHSLYIPYKKPGLPLAKIIFEKYTDEEILFLENHGIILVSDSLQHLLDQYKRTVKRLENLTNELYVGSDIQIEHTINQYTKGLSKPVYWLQESVPTHFYPITADHFLFLQSHLFESSKENLSRSLTEWMSQHQTPPSVCKVENQVYVIGKSYEQCQNKEEYLRSYLDICSGMQSLHLISQSQQMELLGCTKEKLRLQV